MFNDNNSYVVHKQMCVCVFFFLETDGQLRLDGAARRRSPASVMPINGNTLAKYLVMVTQVVAWCTVSAMLLRRGLNQVHTVPHTTAATTQQPMPSYNKTVMVATDETAQGNDWTGPGNETGDQHRAEAPTTRSLDGNGTPAVMAGIIMITIAVIMLIISPTIMLMKMIEKRKKRILNAVSKSPSRSSYFTIG